MKLKENERGDTGAEVKCFCVFDLVLNLYIRRNKNEKDNSFVVGVNY